jgi:predicted DNA-binding ribbon-helix-helix protein
MNIETSLQIHPRPSEIISLEIPSDVLQSLQEVAKNRDMSVAALLKLYIGQGLRNEGSAPRRWC